MSRRLDPARKTSAEVQEMFAAVAPRYDLLNRVLSVGLDRVWRRRAVERVLGELSRGGLEVLDVCSGTGDLAGAFARDRRVSQVTGVDFVEAMVARARSKWPGLRWLAGDALAMPLGPRARFDVVSMAFGLRNLVDPAEGIRGLVTHLRPGGRLAVLEFFTPPDGLRARLFRGYFHHVLPRLGRWLSGGRAGSIDAYRYLPESVRAFQGPASVETWMRDAGLVRTATERMGFGSVALVLGDRPPAAELPDGAGESASRTGLAGAALQKETAGLVRI